MNSTTAVQRMQMVKVVNRICIHSYCINCACALPEIIYLTKFSCIFAGYLKRITSNNTIVRMLILHRKQMKLVTAKKRALGDKEVIARATQVGNGRGSREQTSSSQQWGSHSVFKVMFELNWYPWTCFITTIIHTQWLTRSLNCEQRHPQKRIKVREVQCRARTSYLD